MENEILAKQKHPDRVLLNRAQCTYYSRAKVLQTLFLAVALLLPAIGANWGADHPEIKPYLALISTVVLVVEIFFGSRAQKQCTKTAAKIQEQFDTEVLNLPWNDFVVGSKVEPELVRSATRDTVSPDDQRKFETWYHDSVATIPLPLARLVCQRTNISYDMRVREIYSRGLLVGLFLLGIALSFWGLHEGLNVSGLLTSVLVPFTPLAALIARELRKQADTIETLTSLKLTFDKLWAKAMKDPHTTSLEQDARNLQDAIYRNRTSNPLVYDWVYKLTRKNNEDVSMHGAAYYVEQARHSLAGMRDKP